ncbi:MAG: hypothetical protein ACI9FR_003083 [Cryomorphaceae bacterium]|jgi:hypothetical protein
MKAHLSLNITLCAALLLVLYGCSGGQELSPEDQVKQVLSQIEQGVEARSMSAVMDHISADYRDHQGMTKEDLTRMVQMYFVRNQQINLFTRIRSIDISDGLASIELSAAMAAHGVNLSQDANRIRADTHKFSVLLSDQNGTWVVSSVSWQRGW